jgi:hypothetical protein
MLGGRECLLLYRPSCASCLVDTSVTWLYCHSFKPKMKQRRQILLGIRDPITQKQKAFKLLLDDK